MKNILFKVEVESKWLNFGGDPDYRLDTGIVFGIRQCCEI